MSSKKKTGRLSNGDKAFIRDKRDEQSVEEMARHLGRDEETVRQYVGLGDEPDAMEGARWDVIRKTFSSEEQKFFRQEYDRFKDQLEGDVLPTEEAQLIQALTLWILMNRVMVKQKGLEDDIERVNKYRRRLEETLDHDRRKPTEEELVLLTEYRSDVKGWKQELNTLAGQLNEYSKERNNILRSLKVNRDQRIKDVESGAETFVSLVKTLGRKDKRAQTNREMELLRLAVEREQQRLMEPRIYPDGNEDHPLLCVETLERYDQEVRDGQGEGNGGKRGAHRRGRGETGGGDEGGEAGQAGHGGGDVRRDGPAPDGDGPAGAGGVGPAPDPDGGVASD
jgi:hypothetical protein